MVDPAGGGGVEGRGSVLQGRNVCPFRPISQGVVVDLEHVSKGVFKPDGLTVAQIAVGPAVGSVNPTT